MTISLPASTTFKYKFVGLDEHGGAPVWGASNDRTIMTPARGEMTLPVVDFQEAIRDASQEITKGYNA